MTKSCPSKHIGNSDINIFLLIVSEVKVFCSKKSKKLMYVFFLIYLYKYICIFQMSNIHIKLIKLCETRKLSVRFYYSDMANQIKRKLSPNSTFSCILFILECKIHMQVWKILVPERTVSV